MPLLNEFEINTDHHKTILIAGPTASGKSGLAMEIAGKHDGIIINADSLQVYNCWRILTSRPTPEDEKTVPHFLYGHVSCHQSYSISRWLDEIHNLLKEHKDVLKLIVGGTGLYFTALTKGFASIPDINGETRLKSEELIREDGIERLLLDLKNNDSSTYHNLDKHNPRRIQRAWEVLQSTGMGLSSWFKYNQDPLVKLEQVLPLILDIDKSRLEENIKLRLDRMLKSGALDECRRNVSILDMNNSAGKAIGASVLTEYTKGNLPLEEAKCKMLVETRQYAKRQRTWFRNKMAGWQWKHIP
ncbi:MAG: tRNA (adenosine(37)-N6)-dimethylallyltransferase MiaA [Rhodobacteraceae bacterium]|nr:tRNA (adenosine(37)-N6)-dimethylallyltransferase MiaA [Paracoccaceae bacterium]